MHTAAGPWGRRLTSLIVTVRKLSHHLKQSLVQVYCFGTCITFLIIIGDQVLDSSFNTFSILKFFWQFDRAFASLIGPEFCHIWYLNRDFIMPATR